MPLIVSTPHNVTPSPCRADGLRTTMPDMPHLPASGASARCREGLFMAWFTTGHWYHNGRITSAERGSLTCFEEENLCEDSKANASSSPAARTGSGRRPWLASPAEGATIVLTDVNGSAAEAAARQIAGETGATILSLRRGCVGQGGRSGHRPVRAGKAWRRGCPGEQRRHLLRRPLRGDHRSALGCDHERGSERHVPDDPGGGAALQGETVGRHCQHGVDQWAAGGDLLRPLQRGQGRVWCC